jgi:hypothetical protein
MGLPVCGGENIGKIGAIATFFYFHCILKFTSMATVATNHQFNSKLTAGNNRLFAGSIHTGNYCCTVFGDALRKIFTRPNLQCRALQKICKALID